MYKFKNDSLTKIIVVDAQVNCSLSVDVIPMPEANWDAIRSLNPDMVFISERIKDVPIDFKDFVLVVKDDEDITPSLNLLLQPNENLISVFTSTHNIGFDLMRTYKSLQNQTHTNWEWVVVDDSDESDNLATISYLKTLQSQDRRIKLYPFDNKTDCNIGEAKYRAAMLCSGVLAVELDHDDVLLPNALEILYKAHVQYPDIAFFYSDWIEFDYKKNQCLEYDGGRFGFNYGSMYEKEINRTKYKVCKACPINPTTVRHIVSMPNHLRAWYTPTLKLLGYNRKLRIADDYELLLRTFLIARMGYISDPLYIQSMHLDSATNKNNQDIQQKVALVHDFYKDAITEKLSTLDRIDPYAGMTHKEFLSNWNSSHFNYNLAKLWK